VNLSKKIQKKHKPEKSNMLYKTFKVYFGVTGVVGGSFGGYALANDYLKTCKRNNINATVPQTIKHTLIGIPFGIYMISLLAPLSLIMK